MDGEADRMRATVEAALRETMRVTERVARGDLAAVVRAAGVIGDTVKQGGKILVFGNGGSAAEAQHFAAELVGRFRRERRALAAIALTTDTSILTAVGNDYGFDRVFARQVDALGRAGDVALAISTSGDSANVIEALRTARAAGLTTIGLTGRDGGAMKALVDIHVNVPDQSTARVQEVQLMLLHALCELVEQRIG